MTLDDRSIIYQFDFENGIIIFLKPYIALDFSYSSLGTPSCILKACKLSKLYLFINIFLIFFTECVPKQQISGYFENLKVYSFPIFCAITLKFAVTMQDSDIYKPAKFHCSSLIRKYWLLWRCVSKL